MFLIPSLKTYRDNEVMMGVAKDDNLIYMTALINSPRL